MKVETLDKSVVSVGGERSGFSIARSSKMFNLLLAGLYSNIHQSVTREIMANAYDAHAEAGTPDKQIDVIFPTILNPEFRVRDYGLGLSHDFMMNKYTIVGHSEKEGTNEQVGYWGIGRLSPFAYTTQYTVISVHDSPTGRLKSTYLVSMNSAKEPEVTFFGSEKTAEPTGLQVSFPIKNGDVGNFKEAFKLVLLGYKTLPNIINSNEFDPQGYVPLEIGDDYSIYPRNLSHFSGLRVRMGCITYPVDYNLLPNVVRDLRDFGNVIIDFDIGDLAITASRESLSYGSDEPTVKSITDKATKVLEVLLKTFVEKLDNNPDIFKARRYFEKLKNSVDRSIATRVLSLSKYKDNDFDYNFVNNGSINLGVIDWISSKANKDPDWKPIREVHRWSKNQSNYNVTWYPTVKYDKDRIIILDTKSSYLHKRISNYVEKNYSYANYYLISKDETQLIDFLKQYVEPTKFVNLSDIPEHKPVKGARKDKLNVYTYSTRYNSLSDYVLGGDSFDKGGIYVPVVYKEIQPETGAKLQSLKPEEYCTIYDKFKLIDSTLDTNQLTFVPATNLNAFKKADNWKSFEDYYSTWYDTDTQIKLEYIDQVLYNQAVFGVHLPAYDVFKDFPESDGLTAKHDPTFKAISLNYDSSLVYRLLSYNNQSVISNKYKSIIKEYTDNKKKEFPLLTLLEGLIDTNHRELVTKSISKEIALNYRIKDLKNQLDRKASQKT